MPVASAAERSYAAEFSYLPRALIDTNAQALAAVRGAGGGRFRSSDHHSARSRGRKHADDLGEDDDDDSADDDEHMDGGAADEPPSAFIDDDGAVAFAAEASSVAGPAAGATDGAAIRRHDSAGSSSSDDVVILSPTQPVILSARQQDSAGPSFTPFRRLRFFADAARTGKPGAHAFMPEVFAVPSLPEAFSSSSASSAAAVLPLRRFRLAQPSSPLELPLVARRACGRRGHVIDANDSGNGGSGPGQQLSCFRTLVRWARPVPSYRDAEKWCLANPPPSDVGADALGSPNELLSAKPSKPQSEAEAQPVFNGTTGALIPNAPTAAALPAPKERLAFARGGAVQTQSTQETMLSQLGSAVVPSQPVASGAAAPAVATVAPTAAVAAQPLPTVGAPAALEPAAAPPLSPAAVTGTQLNAVQHLTLLSVECFALSRGLLLPDPRHDAVACICYAIHDDGVAQMLLPPQGSEAGGSAASATRDPPPFPKAVITGVIVLCDKPDAAAAAAGASDAPTTITAALYSPHSNAASPQLPCAARLGFGSATLVSYASSEEDLFWKFAGVVMT